MLTQINRDDPEFAIFNPSLLWEAPVSASWSRMLLVPPPPGQTFLKNFRKFRGLRNVSTVDNPQLQAEKFSVWVLGLEPGWNIWEVRALLDFKKDVNRDTMRVVRIKWRKQSWEQLIPYSLRGSAEVISSQESECSG